jgi:hypothetical protein
MRKPFLAAAAALAVVSTAAMASVSFDNTTGTGFVGKGDVQLALGLNNAQVQAITPAFTYNATTITEVSWECTNANNEKVLERARTTTTSSTGVVSSSARVQNQVTGYNLGGFAVGSTTSSSSTEGPPLNSCPNSAGSWSLTRPAGEATVISTTGGLYVNGVLLQ